MPPLFTKPMEKTARFQPKFEWPGIVAEFCVSLYLMTASQTKPRQVSVRNKLDVPRDDRCGSYFDSIPKMVPARIRFIDDAVCVRIRGAAFGAVLVPLVTRPF
jgi:hypothetical protein